MTLSPLHPEEGRAVGDIPPEVFERAEILMDQFRHIEDDRELIARVLMEVTPPRLGLTGPQSEALTIIAEHTAKHGSAPSYAEIAVAMGFASKGPVHHLVHQLAERGAIKVGRHRARSISIVGGP